MVQKSVKWQPSVTDGRPKWSQQVPLGTKSVPNNARLSKVGTKIITIAFPMGGLPLSFIYIYICINPPPCLQAREACPRHPSWFLRSSEIWSCQFFCFKDPAGPGCNSPHDPFSDNFALFFRNTFLTTICTKKAPTGPPKTHQNLKNLQKIWPLDAPAAELCKKAPSGRGKAIKACRRYVLETFRGTRGLPKSAKMRSKMEPPATQNPKKLRKK